MNKKTMVEKCVIVNGFTRINKSKQTLKLEIENVRDICNHI